VPQTFQQTAPPAESKGTSLPRQIKFIIGNEVCERFSYYGMIGILELYLKERMQMGAGGATQVLHLFGTAVYFLPLLGGWLADRYWGRYWTILSISVFYCLGHGTLALFEGSRLGLFAGLALLAIGAGGIKPCVSAFVGDQFGPNQDIGLRKVYGWFYWAINVGAAFGYLIIPIIRNKSGYGWAFGVPGVFMGLATLIFALGTKQYVRQPPVRADKGAGFWRVTWYVLTHGRERKRGSRIFDVALDRFSPDEVKAARAVARILTVFSTVPMFWALFNQVNSTWVLQGKKMTPLYVLDGETMQSAGAVLVMIWVPILTLIVYPWLERRGILPTRLRRMSAGMVLGAVSFVLCGIIQGRMDHGAALSVAWQLVPYSVLEAGEVMLSATALEFAFSQAPERMKSIIMSFWLMTIAGGHFLVAVFTNLNSRFVHAHGAAEFYFYAVLMFVVAGGFIFLARRYGRFQRDRADLTGENRGNGERRDTPQ
jgi:POT family proton-dependent oligopeptide transporter